MTRRVIGRSRAELGAGRHRDLVKRRVHGGRTESVVGDRPHVHGDLGRRGPYVCLIVDAFSRTIVG
jgi:hypothetical protein